VQHQNPTKTWSGITTRIFIARLCACVSDYTLCDVVTQVVVASFKRGHEGFPLCIQQSCITDLSIHYDLLMRVYRMSVRPLKWATCFDRLDLKSGKRTR
jgi:hypothetical protein